MPKVFTKAAGTVMGMLGDVLDRYHADLKEVDAKVGVIMVEAAKNDDGFPTGPAVKFAGARAMARVKLVTPRQRVHVKLDAEIEIDADEWPDLTKDQQWALLDHELTHLAVKRDKDGAIKLSDDLRPVLKIIPDDWILTGFREVVVRHGDNAMEAQALRSLCCEEDGQRLFPWASKTKPRAILKAG